jgi:hypothetical protein
MNYEKYQLRGRRGAYQNETPESGYWDCRKLFESLRKPGPCSQSKESTLLEVDTPSYHDIYIPDIGIRVHSGHRIVHGSKERGRYLSFCA